MENVRRHRFVKLVTADKRRNRLAPKRNYHTTKHMKMTRMKMNKPIYLGMSVLDFSKTLLYEFWYDYIKSKYQDKAKLCYTDTDSFIIQIKTEDFYKDIATDVKKWFDRSSFGENDKRLLPIGKNEKVIGLFKDELGGKIMIEFVGLRANTYGYLMDDDSEHKKSKGTKKCVIKSGLIVKNYKNCLFNEKNILKLKQRFKSDCHNVYTEQVNNIALISNDDKRLQTFGKITTYPYETNAFKVCKSEFQRNSFKKDVYSK